ncbi:MAG TPA: lactonase family protein [Hanamia sp.]|nr:lactonase family protein [Hanamia sp.]
MNKKITALKIPLTFFFLFLFFACPAQKYYLFIGTYTNTGSKGIYVYDFNSKNGDVKWISNTDSVTNPSFLTISKNEKYVYAVNETHGSDPGRVTSYSFDKKNGKLHFMNTTFSGGDDPCFISTSSDNKWLAVANYTSGSAAFFPINKDGTVKPYTQLIHDSIYRDPGDNATPHVHETVFTPDERFLITPDLGLDRLMIYHFEPSRQKPFVLSTPPSVASAKGSGPRHIIFASNKKFAYLIHELSGTVTTYQYHNGKFTQIQDLLTFPAGFTGEKSGAEIKISPDGKFLYTSDRGDLNIITIFSIDPVSGKLTLKGTQSTFGSHPRYFMIDPTGNYLLAANQDSASIFIFKINKKTGLLTKTGKEIHIPRPVCLQMIPKK